MPSSQIPVWKNQGSNEFGDTIFQVVIYHPVSTPVHVLKYSKSHSEVILLFASESHAVTFRTVSHIVKRRLARCFCGFVNIKSPVDVMMKSRNRQSSAQRSHLQANTQTVRVMRGF